MKRNPSWDGIGSKKITTSLSEALRHYDLDYTVEKHPLYVHSLDNSTMIPVEHRFMTVRTDNNQQFGIVSDRYPIIQNTDALSFVEDIDDLVLVQGGHSSWGSVFMIGSLPSVTLFEDEVTPHLIFQTSHDGSAPLKATICMLRIACQNQFSAAFRESPATIKIYHKGDIDSKITAAGEVLKGVYSYVEEYKKMAESMVKRKVTPAIFDQIVAKYFAEPDPQTTSKRVYEKAMDDRDLFLTAYNSDDNQNLKGTRWGVINAYTDFLTHREVKSQEALFFDSVNYTRPLESFIETVAKVK